jgi:hypothetical protein
MVISILLESGMKLSDDVLDAIIDKVSNHSFNYLHSSLFFTQ